MTIPIIKARTLDEALEMLADHENYMPLGGATDIWPKLRHGTFPAAGLVDISAVDLRQIDILADGVLQLGASVTASMLARLAGQPFEPWSLLKVAAAQLGSPQIRNRATVAGNIRTASPCADMVLALVCLDAEVELRSLRGKRRIALSKLLLGPGQVAIEPDELITMLRVPPAPPGSRFFLEKLGNRNALVIALASIAMRAVPRDGRLEQLAISWGSVAPTSVRSTKVEEVLSGASLNKDNISRALDALDEDIAPIDDQRASARYRRQLCRSWLERAIEEMRA